MPPRLRHHAAKTAPVIDRKAKTRAAVTTKKKEKKKSKSESKEEKKMEDSHETKGGPIILFTDSDANALVVDWTQQVTNFCLARDRCRVKWGKDLFVAANIKMGPGSCAVGYNPLLIPKAIGYESAATDPFAAISLISKTQLALDATFRLFREYITELNDERKPPVLEFNFTIRGATGLGCAIVDTWDGYPVIIRDMVTKHQQAKRAYAMAYLKPDRYVSVDLTAVGEHGTGACVFRPISDDPIVGKGYMKQSTVAIIVKTLVPLVKLALDNDTLSKDLTNQLPLFIKHYIP